MMSNTLLLLLALQAAAGGTPDQPEDYAKLNDAELCAILTKDAAANSEQLDPDTRMAIAVDCTKRAITLFFVSQSSDPGVAQKLSEFGDSLDQEPCDAETKELTKRGYVFTMVFDLTRQGRRTERPLKCRAV